MTTMLATTAAFSGLQSVFNWSQDFECELDNAARKDTRYAVIGRQYCTEWIAQFPDETANLQVNFHRALATFHARLGERAETADLLHRVIERWPQDVWGYVALADAHAHFFRGDCELDYDLDKAMVYLEQALAVPGLIARDRKIVEDRMAEVRAKRANPGPDPSRDPLA
jgi:hypothetical protein